MQRHQDKPVPVIRLAAHFLGSLGLVLWAGGLLTSWSVEFLRWFPWEAALADRLFSVLGGASLIAAGRYMLIARPQESSWYDDDGFF